MFDDYDFEMDGNTLKITETTDAMLRDINRTIAAQGEERVKTVLRGLGWIAPEDLAEHDATVWDEGFKLSRRFYASTSYDNPYRAGEGSEDV